MPDKWWSPSGSNAQPPKPKQGTGRCGVCRGRGYTFLETVPGQPSRRITCAYCKGTKRDTFWSVDMPRLWNERRHRYNILLGSYVGFMFITLRAFWWYPSDMSPLYPWLQLLHVALVLLAIPVAIGLVLALRRHREVQAGRDPRSRAARNRRFTSTEEQVLGFGLLFGAALRNHFRHRR